MILVGQSTLTLQQFADLIFKQKEIKLDEAALQKVEVNFKFLKQLFYSFNII